MLRLGSIIAALLALATAAASGGTAPSAPIQIVRLRFVDHSRVARLRSGKKEPRVLLTYVRYPADISGPLPLVVFGHGFASTPGRYAALLNAWARAGYVVAAPLFPLENANAPSGPDESDLVYQPGDMSFVITRLLAPGSPLRAHIDASEIAVAGQSDGAETAYAVAFETHYRDPRVRAAVILTGAELGGGTVTAGPPLLAVQGMRDKINPSKYTMQLFRDTGRPKFLLRLFGAGHLPPYTTNAQQLAIVERVTIAFLDTYLKRGPLSRLLAPPAAPSVARLTAAP